jgi:hypothetical protein
MCRPLPGAMPLATIQRLLGTTTRSSAFWTPQTKFSPPDGVHAGACALIGAMPQTMAHASETVRIADLMNASAGL